MIAIKKKYRNKTISNGNFKKFNTNDIDPKLYKYYFDNGFEFIFEKLKDDKVKSK